jgi:hypothetical protein
MSLSQVKSVDEVLSYRDGGKAFATEGFELIPGVLPERKCDGLIRKVMDIECGSAGTRNLLSQSWCCDLAEVLRNEPRIRHRLSESAVAVQCTFFDKSDRQNWLVAFHQDLSIPVEQRINSTDCTAWSEKEGTVFVQPPTEVLRQLVAVRVHLDNSVAENGPLRVLPGSHREGRLRAEQIQQWRRTTREVSCIAPKGSVLLMSPLLLHASSKAESCEPRRVLHFLFGPPNLPSGLKWRSFNGGELRSE